MPLDAVPRSLGRSRAVERNTRRVVSIEAVLREPMRSPFAIRLRALVFLLSLAVLLTASGSLYPQHAAEFDTLRGFIAVGGLY
jgi:hypothetical protein